MTVAVIVVLNQKLQALSIHSLIHGHWEYCSEQKLVSALMVRILTKTSRVIGVNFQPHKPRTGKAQVLGERMVRRRREQLQEVRLELRSEGKETTKTS